MQTSSTAKRPSVEDTPVLERLADIQARGRLLDIGFSYGALPVVEQGVRVRAGPPWDVIEHLARPLDTLRVYTRKR